MLQLRLVCLPDFGGLDDGLGRSIPIVGGGWHPLAQHLIVALQQRHALDDLLVRIAVIIGSINGIAVGVGAAIVVVAADSTIAIGMQIIKRIVHCFAKAKAGKAKKNTRLRFWRRFHCHIFVNISSAESLGFCG